eukprot:CAMPEP_0201994374 /NCGR_PEP_ID=MMETSP0905-20130828/2236_1 /ASSEMBLY_ACC=CAM_ASM_000554 /TAXON_ID=420261 /ORGANISM="Thalassiosira antarctica, Strain CCMP982" /LENGTH=458 /DNA_ID=CAMNT_0048549333 /DNA_START=31 /DNA_END=1407 /DNA_ORIENTATION=+
MLYGQNKPPPSDGNRKKLPALPPFPMNEEDGGVVRKNNQYCSDNSSACRGVYTMGQGIPMGSWSGGQSIPTSYRGDSGNDVDFQPASDPKYSNYGSYSNYSSHGGRSSMGISNFQDEDESINYLAARAHAAQMLAAEESRRLEENLMRLEMRRRMMLGGSGPGMGMDGGEQGLSGNQVQFSNSSSSGMHSKSDDCILMARAQKFNMPQSQMNMMDGSSNNSLNQCIGMDLNWNHAGNTSGFTLGSNPSNNPQNFTPLKAGDINGEDVTRVPGEAVDCQDLYSGRSTTARAALAPKKTKALDAPRRPLSAYNIFFSEMRETILKENEDNDKTECKAEWRKNATDADEAVTIKPFAEEKQEHPKDMEAFTQNLMKKRLNKKPIKRVHRKSHGKVSFTTLAKTVGQRWRELPEEQKKKYKDLAEIDRARYRKEKAAIGKVLREAAKEQRKEAKARQNTMTQ